MKPIEPGCRAIYHDPDTFCEVTVGQGPGKTSELWPGFDDYDCMDCGSYSNQWRLFGGPFPSQWEGGCGCHLTRIDGHDPEAEPEAIDLPVILGVR